MSSGKSSNEVGKKYGELTVIGSAGDENQVSRVICRCSCGNICINCLSKLKNSEIRSCGCIWSSKRVHKRSTTGVVGVNYIKRSGMYIARLKFNGVYVCNKRFPDIYHAILARRDIELKYFGKTVIDLDRLREAGII